MTIEFQSDVLKFLTQTKQSKKYVQIIDPDFFSETIQQTVFTLLKNFLDRYNSLPSKGNLLEYFHKQMAQQPDISKELIGILETGVHSAFNEFKGSSDHIKEVIIERYQLKLIQDVYKETSGQLKGGDMDLVNDIFKKVHKIKKLGDQDGDQAEQNRGQFLLQEYQQGNYEVVTGEPTYLHALNNLTSTKGFYPPQLVIFMGAPKSFKTGTLLNIAHGYTRDGYKVYYADAENSQGRIRDRVRQRMLECTFDELVSGKLDTTLTEQVDRYKAMGGDFRADFYPAHTKTLADVDDELDFLKEEYGWEPDIICYDYLDLFQPEDRSIKEKRLQIQAVYFDAIRLQKRRNMIGFSLSQVSKGAVDKRVIDMTGFAEDFGKAANCHAAFALCRTPEEKQAGVMRIVPVVQRDGQAQHTGNAVFVNVDESRMLVQEIDKEDWTIQVDAAAKNLPKESKPKTNRPRKPVQDE